MSDYEPPAEQIEALAVGLRNVWNNTTFLDSLDGCSASEDWRNVARFVLRRQHERENRLRDAMDRAAESLENNYDHPSWAIAWLREALAAHAKLDAPKVPEAPTLLEAAKAYLAQEAARFSEATAAAVALKAAVEREEKR